MVFAPTKRKNQTEIKSGRTIPSAPPPSQDPVIVDFWGLAGPGGPGDTSKRWGASPPTFPHLLKGSPGPLGPARPPKSAVSGFGSFFVSQTDFWYETEILSDNTRLPTAHAEYVPFRRIRWQHYGKGFDTEAPLGRGRVPELLAVLMVFRRFPWVSGRVSSPPRPI